LQRLPLLLLLLLLHLLLHLLPPSSLCCPLHGCRPAPLHRHHEWPSS
jgi:hypothetical protein